MRSFLLICVLFLLPNVVSSQLEKKVLIIGIDGARADALIKAQTPNLDQLIANGILSPHALNGDITISGPGWSAILCGVLSDKHEVTNNDFGNNNYDRYPSIFRYVNDHNPDLQTVSICHWAPINDFIIGDDADLKLNVSTDEEVTNAAEFFIKSNDPDLVFLHYDDVDHAGHSLGFSPNVPEYIAAIEVVDSLIGPVLQTIKDRPEYDDEDWLILVTTDHGGKGTGHGGNSIEEQTVFVIASGDNVPDSLITRDSTIVIDDSFNCLGLNEELQFDGINDLIWIAADSLFDFGADRDFSIECRVRTPESSDVHIIGNKDWDSGYNKGFVFSFKFPSGPEWKVNIGDGSNRADINTGGLIADNEWYTLSATFDRDGFMRMYQDGVFIDSADISFIQDINTGQGIYIGADINEAYDFSGSIAEVRIWDAVLDAQTISDWHCKVLESTHPAYNNLIGYWKMNEGPENEEIVDSSPNSNPGLIEGASWKTNDSSVVYSYLETPRLVDVPYSALAHLCIPIMEEWELDGKPLIVECLTTSQNEHDKPLPVDISFSPNPAKDATVIQMKSEMALSGLYLDVYRADGDRIESTPVVANQFSYDTSSLLPGVYFFIVRENEGSGRTSARWLVVQ